MEKLDEKIEKAKMERARRYPLLDMTDNLTEIREISEDAIVRVKQLCPDLVSIKVWETIPRVTMEFLEATFKYLGEHKSTKVSEVFVPLGDMMELGIEYASTAGADKEGTLNPVIRVGKELKYETSEDEYDDILTADMAAVLREEGSDNLLVQFFNNREIIRSISEKAITTLFSNYGIQMSDDWTIPSSIFVAFFRAAKQYLIEHKDAGEFGVEVKFGRVVTFGIEKEGVDDNDISYLIYVTPGQDFKLDNAKSDSETEVVK